MSYRAGNITVCIVLIGCIIAAATFLYKNDNETPAQKTEATVPTETTTSKGKITADPDAAVSKVEDTVTEKKDKENIKTDEKNTPPAEQDLNKSENKTDGQVVSGQIVNKEMQTPEESLEEKVDKALADQTVSENKGDVVRGQLNNEEEAQPVDAEDSVIRYDFVTDLSRWLCRNYVPSHTEGKQGNTRITLKQANLRYSNSASLKGAGRDEFKRRNSILRYVLTEGNLEALYRLYQNRFLNSLNEEIRKPGKNKELTTDQLSDFFDVYADFLHRMSLSFKAVSDVDIMKSVQAISEAEEKEDKINEAFSLAYTAYSIARDNGNQAEAERQSSIMFQKSREGRELAALQENKKASLISAIRENTSGKLLSETDLLFLTEWIVRHDCSEKVTLKIADLCEKLSASLRLKSIQITRQVEVNSPETSILWDESENITPSSNNTEQKTKENNKAQSDDQKVTPRSSEIISPVEQSPSQKLMELNKIPSSEKIREISSQNN